MGMDPVPEAEVDAWVADRTKAGAVVTLSKFDRLAMAIGAGARAKLEESWEMEKALLLAEAQGRWMSIAEEDVSANILSAKRAIAALIGSVANVTFRQILDPWQGKTLPPRSMVASVL